MSIDRKTLTNELEELARLSVKSLFYKWKSSHYKQFDPLILILKNLKTTIGTNGKSDVSPVDQWYELECVFHDIENWLDAFDPMMQVGDTEELILDWSTQFQDYMLRKPEQLNLAYPEDFWKDTTKDSVFVRAVKTARRFRNGFGSAPENMEARERRIKLKDLLLYYVDLPVRQFIQDEKKQYLKRISWKVQNAKQKLDQTRDLLVVPLRDTSSKIGAKRTIARSKVHKIITGIDELVDSINSWSEYETQIDERFSKVWRTISKQLDQVWEKAATFQHPNSRFSRSKSHYTSQKIDRNAFRFTEQWTLYFRAMCGSLQKDLELTALQFRLGQLYIDTTHSIEERIEDKILPAFNILSVSLKNAKNRLNRQKSSTRKLDFIKKEKETLLPEVREKYLPTIITAIIQSEVQIILENYIEHVHTAIQSVSEKLFVFKTANILDEPGKSRFEEIPLKKIIKHQIQNNFARQHEQLCQRLKAVTENMLRSVSEVDHVLNFHFEDSVDRAVAGYPDEAYELVAEGLKWANNLIERLKRESQELKINASLGLRQLTVHVIDILEKLGKEEDLFDYKVQYLRALRKFKRERLLKKIRASIKKVVAFPEKMYYHVKEGLIKFYNYIVTDSYEKEEYKRRMADLSSFLNRVYGPLSHIPFVYRRLFTVHPLEEEELFIGRFDELMTFQSVLENAGGNLAVVGVSGGGKSTLINVGIKRFSGERQVVHLDLPRRMTTSREMSDYLNDFKELRNAEHGALVIVEDVEKMFLRCVGGFDALRTLLDYIRNSSPNHVWVLSASRYAWDFLNNLFELKAIFRTQILLYPFDENEIYQLIEGRHRMSGYHLKLPESMNNLNVDRLSDGKANHPAFHHFFNRIRHVSYGNPKTVIRLWMSCVDTVKDDQIHLVYQSIPEMHILSQLPDEDIVIMKMLMLHHSLTSNEISIIFRWDVKNTLARVEELREKDIVLLTGDVYTLHPFVEHYLSESVDEMV